MSHYLQWSRHEQVAAALALFKTEREIRKTGRLDLVTWVQYICGFGYPGPSEPAWAQLFSACRVIPSLHPGRTYLREHEIAVLLAYSKITPDNGDSMTPAQLVKHRIKPAVLGRSVARTPGILYHIHQKFENWALGPFTDMYCALCVNLVCPEPLPPPNHSSPNTLSHIGDTIRQSANAHTNATLKSWGSVMTSVLDLDVNNKSARMQRFEAKLHEKRRFIYQQMYVKISEQWLRSTTSAELQSPFNHSEHSDCTSQPSVINYDFTPKSPKLDVCEPKVKGAASSASRISFPPWSVVVAEVMVCRLHKCSRYGQAALDFIPSESCSPQGVNYAHNGSAVASSTPFLRIGSNNPPSLCAEVSGIPLSHACRGLSLRLKVGVLPPRLGSERPRFEIVGIESVNWVELSEEQDKHCKHELFRKSRNLSSDGGYVPESGSMRRQTFDLSHGIRKHEMDITVPSRLLRRVRMETRIAEDCGVDSAAMMKMEDVAHTAGTHASCASLDLGLTFDDDGCESFKELCWIDWYTNAMVTYVTPADGDFYAVTAAKTDMLHFPIDGRSITPDWLKNGTRDACGRGRYTGEEALKVKRGGRGCGDEAKKMRAAGDGDGNRDAAETGELGVNVFLPGLGIVFSGMGGGGAVGVGFRRRRGGAGAPISAGEMGGGGGHRGCAGGRVCTWRGLLRATERRVFPMIYARRPGRLANEKRAAARKSFSREWQMARVTARARRAARQTRRVWARRDGATAVSTGARMCALPRYFCGAAPEAPLRARRRAAPSLTAAALTARD
ncbi:hypothetical protein FGB62_17g445 [Gracilaria domingensis]|nr:hypothetical protein FGB62_17g445 [Gracilaria domingensis]